MSDQGYDPTDLDQQEADAETRLLSSMSAEQVEDADFVWLMSGPRGRRIVRRLIHQAGVFKTSFHPNGMQMSKQEGAKETGYELLRRIDRLCPTRYTTMNEEHRNARAVASH